MSYKSDISAYNTFRKADNNELHKLRVILPSRITEVTFKIVYTKMLQMLAPYIIILFTCIILNALHYLSQDIVDTIIGVYTIVTVVMLVIFTLLTVIIPFGIRCIKAELLRDNVYIDEVEYIGRKMGISSVKVVKNNEEKIFSFEEKVVNIDGIGKRIVKGNKYTAVFISRYCNDEVIYVDFIQDRKILRTLERYLI